MQVQAHAQVPTPPTGAEPRTWLQLQFTAASLKSASRADGLFVGDVGTAVQHEGDLGQPRHSTVPSLLLGQRIGTAWRIEGEYAVSRRSGGAVLPRDIVVDGYTFASGSSTRSRVELATLRIQGGYSLWQAGGTEWGLSFGGQAHHVGRRIDGMTREDGGTAVRAVQVDVRDVGFQPVVGAYGTWQWNDAWQLAGKARFGVGGGSFTNLSVDAQWRLTPHIRLGAGYSAVRANLDITTGFISDVSHLVLNYRLSGPQVFVQAGF